MSAKAQNFEFERTGDFVQSLARGLSVLRAFDRDHPSLSLAAIAARTGLSRAAARRLVLTLQHLGYLRAVRREFTLAPRVLELGFAYLGSLNLTEFAQPWMETLSRQVDESCSMAVLDGQSIVYVARVPVRKVMTVSLGVGARLPAFCSSMGRVLLAGLTDSELSAWLTTSPLPRQTDFTIVDPDDLRRAIGQVRDQGFAYVEQELELGLCSIAAPVRNRDGRVAAALNIGMRFHAGAQRHAVEVLAPALREIAGAIEHSAPPDWLPAVSVEDVLAERRALTA
ncbi:MAG TPA: IclR family transcriptional regulator C-terminal domain-containing protein [Caulobacteraceae bacterium]|jgi:IclR family pca regulon transcriptional regulator